MIVTIGGGPILNLGLDQAGNQEFCKGEPGTAKKLFWILQRCWTYSKEWFNGYRGNFSFLATPFLGEGKQAFES